MLRTFRFSFSRGVSNPIFLTAILLGFIEPECITHMAGISGGLWTFLHLLFEISRIIAYEYAVLAFIMIPKRLNRTFMIHIFLFLGWLLCVNFLNHLGIRGAISFSLQIISIIVILNRYIETNYFKEFVSVFYFWLFVLCLINFATQFIYPSGIYLENVDRPMWLFGNRNAFIYNYLLCIIIATLKHLTTYGKLKVRYFFVIAILVCSEILGKSVTSAAALLIPVILIVFYKDNKLRKDKLCYTALLFSIAITFVIIIAGMNTSIGRTMGLYFNKDSSFSGRTEIWESALSCIRNNLWTGSGWGYIPLNWRWDVGQCHNMYLDLLFVGGIPLLVLFLLIIRCGIRNLKTNSNRICGGIFSYIFIGYCIVFLMEARRNEIGFFLFMALMYYSKEIDSAINAAVKKND